MSHRCLKHQRNALLYFLIFVFSSDFLSSSFSYVKRFIFSKCAFNFSFFLFLFFGFLGSGLQIKEALQLQLDVQRRLHEQLEVRFLYSSVQILELQELEITRQNTYNECFTMFSPSQQIQRNLQLQIEEQGRQLKMMFDKQQRKSNSLFKSQSSDITSPDLDHDRDDYDDAPSNNGIDEVQVSIAEASGNTNFPSKIS